MHVITTSKAIEEDMNQDSFVVKVIGIPGCCEAKACGRQLASAVEGALPKHHVAMLFWNAAVRRGSADKM